MAKYRVNVLETWYRNAYIEADTPEQALEIARDPMDRFSDWGDPEYLGDIFGSEVVYDDDGNEVLTGEVWNG